MQALVHQTQVLKFLEPHAICYVSLKSVMSEEAIAVTNYNHFFWLSRLFVKLFFPSCLKRHNSWLVVSIIIAISYIHV